MKTKLVSMSLSFIFLTCLSSQILATNTFGSKKVTVALFDTAHNESYHYDHIAQLANASNMEIDYYPLHRVLDTPQHEIPFQKYDCSFFVLCPEMLKGMQTSPAAKKVLALIKQVAHMPNKLTGLLFPSMNLGSNNPMAALSPLFSQLGIKQDPNNPRSLQHHTQLSNLTNRFLQLPPESRPRGFHTSLNLPRQGRPFNATQTITGNLTPLALLPIKKDGYQLEVKSLFPFGLYWFNPTQNNHLFISNNNLLTFSGISENFQLCPMDFPLRKKMLEALQQMLWELNSIFDKEQQEAGINTKQVLASQKIELPAALKTLGTRQNQSNQKTNKIAWMELMAFESQEPKKVAEQKILIKMLAASGLDSLWISINPNMYYSPIAKLSGNKKVLLNALASFTEQLQEEVAKQKAKPPAILISFEIANNLYNPNLPKPHAQDLYGNSYPDVPAPLDKEFWKNEVMMPLEQFLVDWKKPGIANGIKISGVILDLEMYCRKTTGSFLQSMGFEKETISQFLSPPLASLLSSHSFTNYLIDNRLASKYFAFLEKKAKLLGQDMKNFFNQQLPGGIIGCYAPNISIDWFYKGFYKGLSSPQEPLHLFTFNTEFDSHKKWLAENDIQANHSGVLMLSKLRTEQDFGWTKKIAKHHSGVWLNRFSRIAEIYHKDWSTLEQTPLSFQKRFDFTRSLRGLK
ncbi:hypothetical protein KAU11_01340 [Candidatus Babeliales bacterium]|nr:hypothetical protein [Candidatus Babeliales bacterium]